jgi:hypothetical protein
MPLPKLKPKDEPEPLLPNAIPCLKYPDDGQSVSKTPLSIAPMINVTTGNQTSGEIPNNTAPSEHRHVESAQFAA